MISESADESFAQPSYLEVCYMDDLIANDEVEDVVAEFGWEK